MQVPAGLGLPADGDARLHACAVGTLGVALLTSVAEPDVSGAFAVLALVGVAVSSADLMKLYVLFTPASIVMDIIRLAVAPHKVNGFIVFLDVIEMLLKLGGTYYGYGHWKALSGLSAMGSPNQPFSSEYSGQGQQPYSPPQGGGGVGGGIDFEQPDQPVV
mmetsp:Transcript_7535/g.13576  ORF Transcript_7535/g.13576 Transcript_7535/m.13576 type:complete len:161 (-) Transcript_7535:407-889(-)